MKMSAQEVANRLQGELVGVADVEITALASLEEARRGDLSFFKTSKYAKHLHETKASAVLVAIDWQGECTAPAIIRVDDPDLAFSEAAQWFAPPVIERLPGIHPTAIIGKSVTLGEGVHIGPWSVIEDNAKIGDHSVIEAQVFIGHGVTIGKECHIYPQVTIREGCRLGARVVLHSGVRIGGDGYGYNTMQNEDGSILVEKIPQLGIVELGDDVEIGSNTTIDRARFGRTRIGNSTKVDNLVQIGHNVQVGDCSGIIAQAGVAGSTRIGSGCLIWAQAGLSGHLTVGERAQVGPKSGLSKDVPDGEYYLGLPAVGRREFAAQLMLPRQVDKIKKQIAELKAQLSSIST